ncbi:50S ribosomal protein L7/L12 [bacterium]|nr:50S ribosomal protein L7/L12 [bacterium]
MTVLDLVKLKEALEEKFGVTAAAPMAMAMPGVGPAAAAPAEEEQTEFEVVLKEIGAKKIQVIKVIRQITNLGLKEAKELVDSAPSTIKESATKDEANEIKEKVEAEGATVELK